MYNLLIKMNRPNFILEKVIDGMKVGRNGLSKLTFESKEDHHIETN